MSASRRVWPGCAAALSALLVACSAQVTLQGHTVREAPAPARPEVVVQEVTLAFTPVVRPKLKIPPAFDAEAFRAAVERELTARSMLDADHDGLDAEVLIDDFEVRGSRGTLSALVRLLGEDSIEQRNFVVVAEAEAEADQQALYRRFARLMADELAAATAKRALPAREPASR